MIVRVAVVPHPPILVPQVAAGAAVETADLRDACLVAAGVLAHTCTRWVVVVAADPAAGSAPRGSFAGYGVDVPVALTDPPASPDGLHSEVPGETGGIGGPALPLLVAGWLRAQVGAGGVPVRVAAIPPGSDPAACTRFGTELAERLRAEPDRVGVLVLGDGAAKHTPRAPGSFDHRAAAFDTAVAAALADADAAALLALDPVLADELWVAGREAWQVGAAAARALAPAWQGELLYSGAPYGVAYHVALWTPVGDAAGRGAAP